jgi:hypothetical protein
MTIASCILLTLQNSCLHPDTNRLLNGHGSTCQATDPGDDMRTALVMMTILGCDDGTTDCQYIATINQRWPTIELCNAVSEKELGAFINVSYPTVIAVCQDPAVAETPKAKAPTPSGNAAASTMEAVPTPAEERAEEQSLARRALERTRSVLPTADGMRNLVERQVNRVEDGYSWVIRKLR